MTTPLEAASPPRPRPSGRARPETYDFRWERYQDIVQEAAPLIRRHWQEVGLAQDRLPLDVDWEQALRLAEGGILHVLTVRKEGTLVGFIFSYLLRSLFFSQPWATVQGFWIDPIHRQGMIGVTLFKENEIGMRERGAVAVSVEALSHIEKERGTIGKILKRLGYYHAGDMYIKVF